MALPLPGGEPHEEGGSGEGLCMHVIAFSMIILTFSCIIFNFQHRLHWKGDICAINTNLECKIVASYVLLHTVLCQLKTYQDTWRPAH